MSTTTKTPSIATINRTLADMTEGPKMRISASGKTLFVEWLDTDECRFSINDHVRAEVLACLSEPEEDLNQYNRNYERALYLVGAKD